MKSLSLKTIAGLCAASSAAVIAFAAMAQDAGPPQGPGPDGGPPARGGPGGFRGGDPAERTQELHDQLQITPAQEQSFKTWQAALRPAGPPDRPGRAMRAMTTPQRLDETVMEQSKRDADLRARVIATKAFYNGLAPAQQKAMDSMPPQELLAMEGGFGGRGGGMAQRGGRRGPGGGGNFNPNGGGGFGGQQDFGGPPPQ